MAGAILIEEGRAVSLNSVDFDHITEQIRLHFSETDNTFVKGIYESVDEGGMSFISLENQNEEGFNAFYRAAKIAYTISLKNSPEKTPVNLWKEIFEKLGTDGRWKRCDR